MKNLSIAILLLVAVCSIIFERFLITKAYSQVKPLTYQEYVDYAELGHAKKYDEMVRWVNERIEVTPDNSELYEMRSYAYYLKRDLVKALEDIETAIEKDSSVHFYHSRKSIVLAAMGRLDESIDSCNEVINSSVLSPSNKIILMCQLTNLRTLIRFGKAKQAKKVLNDLIIKFPEVSEIENFESDKLREIESITE